MVEFSRIVSALLATLVAAPVAIEWAFRLRATRSEREAIERAVRGRPEPASEIAPDRHAFDTETSAKAQGTFAFGERVGRFARRVPLRPLALLLFVLDLLALFALVSMTTSLLEFSTLMGYPIILSWLMLTMVVPVLILQYVVFGS